MTFQTLLQLFLVLHITGLAMMTGAVLADFSINGRLNKYLLTDKGRALILLEGSTGLAPLIGGGALLLILTGTGMVIQLKSAVTQMMWFKVKMPLVVLLVLNGTLMARPVALKLKRLLLRDTTDTRDGILQCKTRLRIIYLVQLMLFLAIFVLSIFKF